MALRSTISKCLSSDTYNIVGVVNAKTFRQKAMCKISAHAVPENVHTLSPQKRARSSACVMFFSLEIETESGQGWKPAKSEHILRKCHAALILPSSETFADEDFHPRKHLQFKVPYNLQTPSLPFFVSEYRTSAPIG